MLPPVTPPPPLPRPSAPHHHPAAPHSNATNSGAMNSQPAVADGAAFPSLRGGSPESTHLESGLSSPIRIGTRASLASCPSLPSPAPLIPTLQRCSSEAAAAAGATATAAARAAVPSVAPPPVQSDFTRRASRVGLRIHQTTQKLQKLAKLAKRTSMFDDPTAEIASLTVVIQQDMAALASTISELGDKCAEQEQGGRDAAAAAVAAASSAGAPGAAGAAAGVASSAAPSPAPSDHCARVLTNLKGRLASAASEFQNVLAQRTESLKVHENRRQLFSATSAGAAAAPGSRPKQQQQQPAMAAPMAGAFNGMRPPWGVPAAAAAGPGSSISRGWPGAAAAAADSDCESISVSVSLGSPPCSPSPSHGTAAAAAAAAAKPGASQIINAASPFLPSHWNSSSTYKQAAAAAASFMQTYGHQQQQHQQLLPSQQQDLSVSSSSSSSVRRWESLQGVERTMGELSSVFKDLAAMVGQQQKGDEELRLDASDLESSLGRLEGVHLELQQQMDSIGSHRPLIIKTFTALVAFLLLCVIFA